MTFIRQRVDNEMIMKKTLITLIIAHAFTATAAFAAAETGTGSSLPDNSSSIPGG